MHGYDMRWLSNYPAPRWCAARQNTRYFCVQQNYKKLCYALESIDQRDGFLRTLEPGYRNMRIRRCVNSPLKNQEMVTVFMMASISGFVRSFSRSSSLSSPMSTTVTST